MGIGVFVWHVVMNSFSVLLILTVMYGGRVTGEFMDLTEASEK